MELESLRQKSLKSISWSFVDNIANSGITFLITLILARLLSPSEFGLLGMIMVFIAVSNSIVDSGFSQALIRKKEVEKIDYNTVFLFSLIVSVFLFLLLYVLAPFISQYFNEHKLINITRVMGSLLIINSLSIIQRTLFTKDINFKTQTKISLISSILSGIFAIVLAYWGFGVWSLISQILSKQIFNTVLFWYSNSWRPELEFSIGSFQELFGFGSKLLISGIIDTIYKNIYYLVIGSYYSASLLGQYTRGESFAGMFSSNLTAVIQRVSYPVLSSIHDNEEKLKYSYVKLIKTTMLIAFFLMLSMAAVAKPLITLLIGKKWLTSAGFLQILCLGEMLYPLHALNINLLNIKGRSDLILKLEIIKKIIAVPVIVAGIIGGIQYLLWGSVLLSVIALFLNSHFSGKLIGYSTKNQLNDISSSFIICFLVSCIMCCLNLLKIPIVFVLLLQFTIGIPLAWYLFEVIKLEEFLEVKNIIINAVKNTNTKK